MSNVTFMFKKDTRLSDEAHEAFPQSPLFAEYLAARVRANGGSLDVLDILIIELKDTIPDPDPVTVDAIARLAVESDKRLTATVLKELQNEGLKVEWLVVALQMKFKPANPQKRHLTVDPHYIPEYLAIFTCALAMLKGLEFDPRAKAA